ncbi:MAG TPA: AtpZ/AtpI family protein [Planctomycetota bacterium]
MTDDPGLPRGRASATGDLARYSGLGLAFAATLGVFALAGRWLDGRLGTSPWLLIGGVFLGFALGLRSLVHKVPPASARPRTKPPSDPPPSDPA